MANHLTLPSEKDLQIIKNNIDLQSEEHSYVPYDKKVCLKPWGYEFLVYETKKIGIWYLRLYENHKTSLHCHFKKDTWIIVLEGCAKVEMFQETKILHPMDSLLIPKYKFHSLGTFSPTTVILEIEVFGDTEFSDKNDLLRVDDQYKRKTIGYESSVNIETTNLEKYDYFSFHTNKTHAVNNLFLEKRTIQTQKDFQDLISFKKIFLLSGNILSDFSYIKEGSLLNHSSNDFKVSNPFEVLCIKKIDWEEDRKIVHGIEHLSHIIKSLKEQNESIILTSGCFDILHVGHIHTLKEAKSLGTKLIVCLSSDEQIKSLKGNARPINNNRDRFDLFKIINYVDYILPYEEKNIETEQTLGEIMRLVDPDYWVKGSDYTKEEIIKKHPYLRNIALIDLLKEKSTTFIIHKIINT